MQLQIDEDISARLDEPLDQAEAAATIDEFHANLVEIDAVAEGLDPMLRFGDAARVERDDQPFARRRLAGNGRLGHFAHSSGGDRRPRRAASNASLASRAQIPRMRAR